MSAHPTPAEPIQPAPAPEDVWAARAKLYGDIAHAMILAGARITASLEQDICTPPAPGSVRDNAEPPLSRAAKAQLSTAFDRVSRGVRQSMLLAERLANPPPPRAQRLAASRNRVLRDVENAIQRETRGERAESLHAELLERIEMPEFVDDIDDQPIEDLIRDISRDLGLTAPPGTRPWKRRTPADIALLHARAAQQPRPAAPAASHSPPPIYSSA